ncbi:hypothetical protein GUJ93_ZPchr0002g24532 [Zizania palustris]|uniref:Uncharacterized protein n=1 Tax=Zizania palustris TaxID=103762 RepID=A0A8J5RTV1_ZIZPA|nr:hypothetical protein GUJ93_ZPchr0002g24532 [Zizania palustris]
MEPHATGGGEGEEGGCRLRVPPHLHGPHYIKVRKLCNLELFTAKCLDALCPICEDEITAMVESIHLAATEPGHDHYWNAHNSDIIVVGNGRAGQEPRAQKKRQEELDHVVLMSL